MYTKEDFNLCFINPMASGEMLAAYKILQEIVPSSWEDHPLVDDLDQLLRYVVMVYDPKSPMLQKERDLNNRKQVALEQVGIHLQEKQTEIISHNHPFIPTLVTGYLQTFIKSKEWAAIQAFEYGYWESIRQLMEPIEGKDSKAVLEAVQKKSAIKTELPTDLKRIEDAYLAFYGGDVELQKKSKRKTRPEDFALHS